jgi:protein-L-isoaspartate(D-aspartate) O-methyltransferase
MSTPNHRIRLVMELRSNGITDTRVLGAIERVPRELFTPPQFQDQAYEDTALPIGHGQTLSQPTVVATMSQALEIGPRMKVLEIGTGSGYQTAILSRLARRVYSIERHKPLLDEAEARFRDLRLHNITARLGDGWQGWAEPAQAPFDRILVTAAPADLPEALLRQLAPDGIMVLPLGRAKASQKLVKVTMTPQGYVTTDIAAVRFVPMVAGMPASSSG